MSDKPTLRFQARQIRDAIAPSPQDFARAADLFFTHIKPQAGQLMAGFWPKGNEFDPRPILQRALAQGIVCALPRVVSGRKILEFAHWDAQTVMEEGPYGILQPPSTAAPLQPDIVLVPLLLFDAEGYRLGQGGGYYDATLAHLRAQREIMAVGLAYEGQKSLSSLPLAAHDQRLDAVVTPKRVYDFRSGLT
ncbi:MAG: 5-formyltetrahydrofolate cyclo-ligase [Alphaproteobacteria bacterium]|nr:5-formyltetrahydrofolate cyclo-ligase [Alphaproteobacteria bacterium]